MPDSAKAGTAEATICFAIQNWRLVEFTYDGQERVVEPHTFGVLSDGRQALCGYQTRGGSRTGASTGWKTFRATKMRGLIALRESFRSPRKEYRPGDRGFARILCELKVE